MSNRKRRLGELDIKIPAYDPNFLPSLKIRKWRFVRKGEIHNTRTDKVKWPEKYKPDTTPVTITVRIRFGAELPPEFEKFVSKKELVNFGLNVYKITTIKEYVRYILQNRDIILYEL
jgi:hypothetical protein